MNVLQKQVGFSEQPVGTKAPDPSPSATPLPALGVGVGSACPQDA